MIMHANSLENYNDFNQLQLLRHKGNNNDKDSIRAVAKQFESIFIQMALKSMREANKSFRSELFSSSELDFYQDMYDKQIALTLASSKGIGLADLMVEQLTKSAPNARLQNKDPAIKVSVSDFAQDDKIQTSIQEATKFIQMFSSPKAFVQTLWPLAKKYAKKLNIDPKILLSQSALETGWGKHIMSSQDGRSSFNLFGIKADKSWSGNQVQVKTLEFEQGVAAMQSARFRSYASYDDSFADYTQLIGSSARYAKLLANNHSPESYIHALGESGYATDPNYASKIKRIFHSETLNNAIPSM